MNVHRIKKRALYFGFALALGLFVGLRILEIHTPAATSKEIITDRPDNIFAGESLGQKGENSVTRLFGNDSINLVAFSEKTWQNLPKVTKNANGLGILACRKLYLFDEKGRVLGLADSLSRIDLPVITCDNVQVDLISNKLYHPFLYQALDFLNCAKRKDHLLYEQISEIHLTEELGVIAYTSSPIFLPVILGKQNLANKVKNLRSLLDNHEFRDLLEHSKYVDLRFEGQIVLKKDI